MEKAKELRRRYSPDLATGEKSEYPRGIQEGKDRVHLNQDSRFKIQNSRFKIQDSRLSFEAHDKDGKQNSKRRGVLLQPEAGGGARS
jgi:hypothetical protein